MESSSCHHPVSALGLPLTIQVSKTCLTPTFQDATSCPSFPCHSSSNPGNLMLQSVAPPTVMG